MSHACKTARVRELNDALRCTGKGGRTLLTRAVAVLPPERVAALLAAIKSFDDFDSDNDPWGEHDFGQIDLNHESFFWKIDAYDLNCEFASPDPTDPNVTCRVLTIMTALDI